jgi:hypothetical protein
MNPVSLDNYKKDALYPRVVKAVARLLKKQNEMGVILMLFSKWEI